MRQVVGLEVVGIDTETLAAEYILRAQQLRGRGPFGLVFVDGGRPFDWEAIIALVEPGGILLKDDLTPARPVAGDEIREFLLRDPRLAATEILVSPEMAVIVAVKR